jgi:hypothetical protein
MSALVHVSFIWGTVVEGFLVVDVLTMILDSFHANRNIMAETFLLYYHRRAGETFGEIWPRYRFGKVVEI